MYMLLYVDEILIMRNSDLDIHNLILSPHKCFNIPNLRQLHHFLGIKIHQTTSNLFLFQSQYVDDTNTYSNM